MGSCPFPSGFPLQLRSVLSTALLLIILLLTGAAVAGSPSVPTTLLISKSYDGGPAMTRANLSAATQFAAMSADGRFLAFLSNSENIAPGANGRYQVFVRDLTTGALEVASRTTGGTVADSDCFAVALSADGRFVAFSSDADNLVDSNPYRTGDIFVRDRQSGVTVRASVTSDGTLSYGSNLPGLAITPDGRYVTFVTAWPSLLPDLSSSSRPQLVVKDLKLGTVEGVSVNSAGVPADAGVDYPTVAISEDGRYVYFDSASTNLVEGDTNGATDVFVRDRLNRITSRVSVTSAGSQANGSSGLPHLSENGQFLEFLSTAPNLIGNAAGTPVQACVRDLQTGVVSVESVSSGGALADQYASGAGISWDGRYVTFTSSADNLVPDATGRADVYLHDRLTGKTTRASEARGGGPSNAVSDFTVSFPSPNGTRVVFSSNATDLVPSSSFEPPGPRMLYARDLAFGTTERVSDGAGGLRALGPATSDGLSVSADGRYVAFSSDAANLVPGDTNGWTDVFVWDGLTGTIELESVSTSGQPGSGRSHAARVSADGRFVAFVSEAANLGVSSQPYGFGIYLRDRTTGQIEFVSRSSGSDTPVATEEAMPDVSADGRFVAFKAFGPGIAPGDSNHNCVYVRDRLLGRTECVSGGAGGAVADGDTDSTEPLSMSADGRYVAFGSGATNLIVGVTNPVPGVYVRDRQTGQTERVDSAEGTPSDGDSSQPSISADGRWVAFTSYGDNLAAAANLGGMKAYLKDRVQGTIEVVGVSTTDQLAQGTTGYPSLSPDGQSAIFETGNSWLVPADNNSASDVFVRDRLRGITERVDVAADGTEAQALVSSNTGNAVSGTGSMVAFGSNANNLTGDSPAGGRSVYLRVRGVTSTVPAAPGSLTATLPSPVQVLLQWTDQSNNEGLFRIERSANQGVSWMRIGAAGANLTQFTDTFVVPGTTYLYRVRAANEAGDSDATTAATVTISEPLPQPPTALTVTTISTTTLRLNWQGSAGSFRIERKSRNSGFSEIGTTDGGVTTYDDGGLSANNSYTYQVRAHNSSGDSGYGNPASGTTLPLAPANLEANLTPTGVQVQWTDSNNPLAGMEIDRSPDGGSNWVKVFEGSAPLSPSPPVNEAWTDEATQPSTTYLYRVRLIGDGGASEFAGPVTATTLPPPPAVPSRLTATADSPHSITVSWNSDGLNLDDFLIERKSGTGAFTQVTSVDAKARSFTDTGLQSNSGYVYRVRAHGPGGEGLSPEASGVTLPAMPVSVSASAAGSNSVALTWADSNATPADTEVQRSSDGGSTWAPAATVPAGTTQWTDVSLLPKTTYLYRIRSSGPAGSSAYTVPVGVTTAKEPLGTPTITSVVAANDTEIDVGWSYSGPAPDGFRVLRKAPGGQFQVVGTASGSARAYSDTGLTPATGYSYEVQAYQVGADATTSTAVTATTWADPPGKLSVPKSVQFGKVGISAGKTVTFTLKNSSKKASLAIFGLSTTLPFGVGSAGNGSFLIPPGGTHTIQLTFTPPGKKAWEAELEIVSSEAGKRTTRVELKGTGK